MTKRAPYYSTKPKVAKRTLKFLEVSKNPQVIKTTLRTSSDAVIKGLCNIALNAQKGDVPLSPKQKQALARNRQVIHALLDPKKSIKRKRSLLVQKGNGFFLPLLIGAVASALGSAVFPQK